MIRRGRPPIYDPMNDVPDSSAALSSSSTLSSSSWWWSSQPEPTTLRVHSLLGLGQVFFGLGGVITALGLPACNPLVFALYREVAAGIILMAASAASAMDGKVEVETTPTTTVTNDTAVSKDPKGHPIGGRVQQLPSSLPHPQSQSQSSAIVRTLSFLSRPVRTDLGRFCLLGLTIYGTQAGAIAGIKLAGPVAAAVWQPSQPVFTVAISMMAGWEDVNRRRIGGVLLAFIGCAAMVIWSARHASSGHDDSLPDDPSHHGTKFGRNQALMGHLLFFINCLCSSMYVLLSKRPLLVYPPLLVTAWAYNLAAVVMGMTAYVMSLSSDALAILCPDCPVTSTWTVPSGAYFALTYSVLFQSVAAYGILTWANQHATGTLVTVYTALQPVTAAAVTALLVIVFHIYPSCHHDIEDSHSINSNSGNSSSVSAVAPTACLDPPGWGTLLGMCGVFAGLALVIGTEPTSTSSVTATAGMGEGRGGYGRVDDGNDDDDNADGPEPPHQGLELTS